MQCTTAVTHRSHTVQTYGPYARTRSEIGFTYFPNFTRERQLLQDDILVKFFSRGIPLPEDRLLSVQPVATFMMGAPGSGKTTYASTLANSIHIDPDWFKIRIPEFWSFHTRLASGVVNREASLLAEIALRKAEELAHDFVWDAASANQEWLTHTVARLRASGYRVELVRMVIPKHAAVQRCNRRGRHVPRFVIDNLFDRVNETFFAVYNMFDHVTVVNA